MSAPTQELVNPITSGVPECMVTSYSMIIMMKGHNSVPLKHHNHILCDELGIRTRTHQANYNVIRSF